MKKVLTTALAVAMMLGTNVYGAQPVTIDDIYADGTRVYVEASNGLANETELMLTVIRQGVADHNEALYSMTQKVSKGGETFLFSLTIPDNKRGISGSGTYEISLQNLNGDKVTKTVEYANTADVNAFIGALKTAAQGVSDPTLAYDALDDIIHAPANAGEVFSIGLDYTLFTGKDIAVQNDALNILYANGLTGLTAETLPPTFVKAFATAVYNSGAKTEGINISRLTYGEATPNAGLLNQAVSLMKSTYTDILAYETDFAVAYGLTDINNARVDDMGEKLATFATMTSLNQETISAVTNLNPSLQNKAYSYMVEQIDQGILTTPEQLASLLSSAYNQAVGSTGAGGNGGGGGGGGAAIGGGNNRVPVDSGSVGGATGSGTYENNVGTSKIFGDLASTHWAAASVKYLKNKGIVSGTDAGNFEPDRAVTREEFAKMLVVACGINTDGKSADFADMEENAWYLPYIGAAVEAGIVNGVGDNIFGVGQQISRQDMAVMVKRAMEATNISLDTFRAYTEFADSDAIKDYAKDAVKALFEAKILSGKGESTFDPMGIATRAEAAKIIYETIQ
ncbi:MAG: S-layer homology domain-containing protein [Clostridia bacterium]|nr:S-layer homology domain-containing protein [Clostridia bacterium]